MKQAIAGVTPAHVAEKTVMVVWPSIAAYPSGRWLGGLYSISAGVWVITVGNLLALASIPHALFLYFYRLGTGKSYRLTNRRVVEMATTTKFRTADRFPFFSVKVTIGDEVKSVDLDRFDAIDIVVRPGQAWFHAGDLVFRLGNVETFRLDAVSRPDVFRQTCLKSQAAFKGVRQALQRQAVPV
ncbi:MAG: PH domain-containing protein [Pirellulaceae bacterium]